jgi:hypothetical protein
VTFASTASSRSCQLRVASLIRLDTPESVLRAQGIVTAPNLPKWAVSTCVKRKPINIIQK